MYLTDDVTLPRFCFGRGVYARFPALCAQLGKRFALVVTHDPHTALMAPRRLVMAGGAVKAALERTAEEAALFNALSLEYARSQRLQTLLRKGETLA